MTIRSEIESRIAAYATPRAIPVAYENVPFTKPTSGQFIEVILLSSNSKSRNVAADGIRTEGLFQINCYSQLNTGMGVVEQLAEDIVNLFPVIPKIGIVSIESPLDSSKGMVMDAFICVPVTGRYRVEY